MDVDPPQSGVVELPGLLGQQDAVGGQGQVLDAGDRHQLADQLREVLADQRLAAGDAQLADAHRHRNPNKTFDFLESSGYLSRGSKLYSVFGHAIEAPDVAAIRHADPQVVVQATEGVCEGKHGEASCKALLIYCIRFRSRLTFLARPASWRAFHRRGPGGLVLAPTSGSEHAAPRTE